MAQTQRWTSKPQKSNPGTGGWLTRFRGSHDDSVLPNVDMGTNEGGEAGMTRGIRGIGHVTVRTFPDGTVTVEHGRTLDDRRTVATIEPPEYARIIAYESVA
jgi:hypothetical protein